jgi:hypothetical protein
MAIVNVDLPNIAWRFGGPDIELSHISRFPSKHHKQLCASFVDHTSQAPTGSPSGSTHF